MTRPPVNEFIAFLRCRDLQRTREFYEGLGLPVVLEQSGCLIFAVTVRSYLGFCLDAEPMAEAERVVLTLVTPDVDEWYAHLRERGVPTDGPPRFNERYLITHFYARDPDGYRLEVQRFEDPRWQPAAARW